jgi:hypothetical protein
MSKGQHSFKQSDLTKAAKGAVNAGLTVERIEIEQGKIVLFTASKQRRPSSDNEWDVVE